MSKSKRIERRTEEKLFSFIADKKAIKYFEDNIGCILTPSKKISEETKSILITITKKFRIKYESEKKSLDEIFIGAVINKNYQILDILYSYYENCVCVERAELDIPYSNPLWTAVKANSIKLVQAVLSRDNKKLYLEHKNELQDDIIHFVVQGMLRPIAFIKILLEKGALVSSFNINCDTALHVAIKNVYMNIETINIMIEHDTRSVNKINALHRTPLHIAAEFGRDDVIDLLINKFGANINIWDLDDKSAYDYYTGINIEYKRLLKPTIDKPLIYDSEEESFESTKLLFVGEDRDEEQIIGNSA